MQLELTFSKDATTFKKLLAADKFEHDLDFGKYNLSFYYFIPEEDSQVKFAWSNYSGKISWAGKKMVLGEWKKFSVTLSYSGKDGDSKKKRAILSVASRDEIDGKHKEIILLDNFELRRVLE